MGGQESNFFMDYLDLLEAGNTEQPTYEDYEQMQEMPEEEDDFISNLTQYDDEIEKEASIEERVSSRLNEYIAKIDQMLEGMTGQAMEQGLFDDFDENEEALNFDTRVNPTPYFGNMAQMANPLNTPSSPRYTTSEGGVGEKGAIIIDELSSMLGYTPEFNSVYRDQAKQDALIKQGFGVKNSFHLTGDAVDMKPADWAKLSKGQQDALKQKYDVIYHNNHYHIEPKSR